MNTIRAIPATAEHKISFFLVAAFLISLPFDRFYSQLALAAFILHTLIYTGRSDFRNLFRWPNLVLASVFLVNLAGMLYSPERTQGGKDLTRQLAILLFPLAFSLSHFPWQQYRHQLLSLFSLTCAATILYLFVDALRIMMYHQLPIPTLWSPAFLNHNFSSPIGIHATYLSLYAALSFMIQWPRLWQHAPRAKKIFPAVILLVLAAGLLQLASRSVLIALALALLLFPFFSTEKKMRWRVLVLTLLLLAAALTAIFNIDSLRQRYISGLKQDLLPAQEEILMEPRALRWSLVWDLIQKQIFTGYGHGTEKKILKEAYYERKLYNSFLHELNAHNQYLSIWLKTGLWGLLLFLLTLGYGFLHAGRRRDFLYFSFLLLVSLVAFSENLLDVNKGIFFYAFFFSFFVFSGKPFSPKSRLDPRNTA